MANAFDHCRRKCHVEKVAELNASLGEEGLIPAFVDTLGAKKECTKSVSVSNFFPTINKGRLYPKGGVDPKQSALLALCAPSDAGAVVVSGGNQASSAGVAAREVRSCLQAFRVQGFRRDDRTWVVKYIALWQSHPSFVSLTFYLLD